METSSIPEAWAFEHTVLCPAAREFAWKFWTDVSNWKLDADVEDIELHGLFEAGTCGATLSRASGRIEWTITEVWPESGAVIEIGLPGAVASFRWAFEDADAPGQTFIRQRITLSGEQADALAGQFASALEPGVPAGMQKLSDRIARAAGSPGAQV